MSDLATLGLKLDGRGMIVSVDEAKTKLGELADQGERAEKATKELDQAMKSGERSTRTAAEATTRRNMTLAEQAHHQQRLIELERQHQQAQQQSRTIQQASSLAEGRQFAQDYLEGAEAEFQLRMARIKEQQVRGLISPAEARAAGMDAAQSYNAGMIEVLDDPAMSGAFQGGEGRETFTQLAGSLKNVDDASRTAGVGVGRLNMTMASLLRQATGTHPAVGQLVNVVGSLALGGGIMVGVLAGLAAVSFGWRKWTEDAREAKQVTEEAIAGLERLREQQRIQDLGPGGEARGNVESREAEAERLRDEIERLERASANIAATGALETSFEAAAAERQRQRRLVSLRERLDEEVGLIEAGGREIARAEREAEQERLAAVRTSAEGAGALGMQINEQRRLAAATQEGEEATERVTRQIAREQAVRAALANTIGEHREQVEQMVHSLMDYIEATEDAERANRAAKEAEEEAAKAAKEAAEANARRVEQLAGLETELDTQLRLLAAHQDSEEAVRDLMVTMAGEAAVRALGADATEKQIAAAIKYAEATERSRQALSDFNEEQREAAAEAKRLAQEQERAAERMERQLIRSLENLGRAFGGAVDQGIALATTIMSIERADMSSGRGRAMGYGTAAAMGAGIGSQSGSAGMGAVGGAAAGFMAAGPWGAVVGGVSGMVTGLIEQGKRAKEAARQFALAAVEFDRAVQRFSDWETPPTSQERDMRAIDEQFLALIQGAADQQIAWLEQNAPWRDTDGITASASNITDFDSAQAELARLESILARKPELEWVLGPYMDAIREQSEQYRRNAEAVQSSTDAFNSVTSALNSPAINLELIRFRAIQPSMDTGQPRNSGSGGNGGTGGSSAGGDDNSVHIAEVNIIQQPGQDGAQLFRDFMQEARRQALRGGGDPLFVRPR